MEVTTLITVGILLSNVTMENYTTPLMYETNYTTELTTMLQNITEITSVITMMDTYSTNLTTMMSMNSINYTTLSNMNETFTSNYTTILPTTVPMVMTKYIILGVFVSVIGILLLIGFLLFICKKRLRPETVVETI
ncbi:hypothetical protein [Carp edema virus]|nr:hypothetical protein [Carp edema virus]